MRGTHGSGKLKSMDIIYLDFSGAFNTASQKMLVEKLKYRLDEQAVRGNEN